MTAPIGKARDEGNCAGAIQGGEEACEDVRKRRVCCCPLAFSGSLSPPGLLHVKSARPRTETSYQAGSGGRVSTTSRSPRNINTGSHSIRQRASLCSGNACPYPGRPIIPTGKYRTGADRAASLESALGVSDRGNSRCIQHRPCPRDATRVSGLNPSLNRRMRLRMSGGVARASRKKRPYPIRRRPRHADLQDPRSFGA